MKKEDVIMWDWQRIVFGATPPEFVLEVVLRTIISFFLLLTILRLLGKKMNGQLNLTESAVMITLGAIISVPMQMPDRGIVVGIVALLCILILEKVINWLAVKNKKLEDATQGELSILVKDGVMDLEEMARSGISRQNLFTALRSHSYYNLAKVKRVYFEACGMINIYPEASKRPGLAVYPSAEVKLMKTSEKDWEHLACRNCGYVVTRARQDSRCPHCGKKQWMDAIF